MSYRSPKEVAVRLGMSEATIHRLIASGSLPAVDFGSRTEHYWRLDDDDIDAWLAARRNGPKIEDRRSRVQN